MSLKFENAAICRIAARRAWNSSGYIFCEQQSVVTKSEILEMPGSSIVVCRH